MSFSLPEPIFYLVTIISAKFAYTNITIESIEFDKIINPYRTFFTNTNPLSIRRISVQLAFPMHIIIPFQYSHLMEAR